MVWYNFAINYLLLVLLKLTDLYWLRCEIAYLNFTACVVPFQKRSSHNYDSIIFW